MVRKEEGGRPSLVGSVIWARMLMATVLLTWLAGCGETPPADPPNVILITVDTLRADRLGAYGHGAAQTPNLDRLAEEGTLFLQATTPLPRTTPALASLMSGLQPHRHGSREVGQPAKEGTKDLGAMLSERGYWSLGLSANGAAGRQTGVARGFDAFVEARDLPTKVAETVTRQALQELEAHPADRPLFLWVHYVDPHFPYAPPRDWGEVPDTQACRELMDFMHRDRENAGWIFSDHEGRSSRALQACGRLYDAEIAYTDHHIGLLLEELEKRGFLEGSLVFFTADHGENLGEDELFYQHGPNVHDASLQVPLIVWGRGIPKRRDAGVASILDVAPTVLSLLGVPESEWPDFDGESLAPRLRSGLLSRWSADRRARERMATAESGSALLLHSYRYLHSGRLSRRVCLNGPRYSLCSRKGEGPELFDREADPDLTVDLSEEKPEEKRRLLAAREIWPPEQARERTVRTPRFKLVERPRLRGGYRSYLYDLEQDPRAETDVSAHFPEEKARLQRALDDFTTSLPAVGRIERSQEQLETLRALGYID